MKYVGITETYDPCFVPDWETKLLEANVVISKELSDEMVEKLLIVQDRVIFHHTVTGQGGTDLEPRVKTPEHEYEQFVKLVDRGFDTTHYVLRLDPIVLLNKECQDNIYKVLDMWSGYAKEHGIVFRCRVSVVDLYPHAVLRMRIQGRSPSVEDLQGSQVRVPPYRGNSRQVHGMVPLRKLCGDRIDGRLHRQAGMRELQGLDPSARQRRLVRSAGKQAA